MNRIPATVFLAAAVGGWAVLLPDQEVNAPGSAPDGWTTTAPRDEIRPAFAYAPAGGVDGKGAFIIRADHRDGLDGCWTKTFPVVGGRHYRFQAFYQARHVTLPRRSIVAQLHWRDAQSKRVPLDEPAVTG